MTSTGKPTSKRFWRDAVLGAVSMLALHACVVRVSVVRGSSMEPALHDGDRLIVDRFGAPTDALTRGDVVVLAYPLDPAVDFVKRIVALPGDRVAMQDGVLFVNGIPDACDCFRDAENVPDHEVPDGCYFVLGDNRAVSCDSRTFGTVPAELIRGRVRARVWPLTDAGMF